ncbi:hypothetical protein BJAS_P3460 [Bathymodiolus japonicus methanotrophic gill symbiont]|uniref:ORF6N domain-containing protein n=1 Tax=Bathymodiolus japonicus methanotrophic gill symbiont TaxID=113269 RepID=UPI001B56A2CB|nr:ORF6N domain-containing protein [Bathymodiolus japonicus methanotrophic gill symbiont]GFO72923.1 hypothetical protein BJAS_P3460 [Bathymodiolus japonicus methanotrophic gill symbiont]
MKELTAPQYNNQTVATLDVLAKFLGTSKNTLQGNLQKNPEKFIEGKHFFNVSHEDLKCTTSTLGEVFDYKGNTGLQVWTERGCARLSKLLRTDEAWDLWEEMEDSYFNVSTKQENAIKRDKHILDRMLCNEGSVPDGYFSVFEETTKLIHLLHCSDIGFPKNAIPDISVGKTWSKFYKHNRLDDNCSDVKIKYLHFYPESYNQSKSNPQKAYCYSFEHLKKFRWWFKNEYIVNHLHEYLKRKKVSTDEIISILSCASKPKSLN